MKLRLTIVIIIVGLLLAAGVVQAERKLTGELVAVNAKQDIVLLREGKTVTSYRLALHSTVELNGVKTSLESISPNKVNNFPQVQFVLTEQGKIKEIRAYSRRVPIIVKKIQAQTIVIKNLRRQQTERYKIKEEVKLIRNNLTVSIADLKEGDRGVAVFGLDNQLQKLKVKHYYTHGLVKTNY